MFCSDCDSVVLSIVMYLSIISLFKSCNGMMLLNLSSNILIDNNSEAFSLKVLFSALALSKSFFKTLIVVSFCFSDSKLFFCWISILSYSDLIRFSYENFKSSIVLLYSSFSNWPLFILAFLKSCKACFSSSSLALSFWLSFAFISAFFADLVRKLIDCVRSGKITEKVYPKASVQISFI